MVGNDLRQVRAWHRGMGVAQGECLPEAASIFRRIPKIKNNTVEADSGRHAPRAPEARGL